MSFGQYILIPIFIAFQAFTMMLLPQIIPGCDNSLFGGYGAATWISFQAWAMYFLAGCTPKTGVKTLLGYIGGIVASIAIFELGDFLSGYSTFWGYPIAVFIVVVFVISAEKLPWFDFVPAWFIGAGVFFGLMQGYIGTPVAHEFSAKGYNLIIVPEIIACFLGLVYGWGTVTFRGWYEAKVAAPAEESAPADAEVENA